MCTKLETVEMEAEMTKPIELIRDEFVKNQYGVKIRKGCCSCRFAIQPANYSRGMRYCAIKRQIINKYIPCSDFPGKFMMNCCDSWFGHQRYSRAGKGDGHIRGDRMYHIMKMEEYNERKEAQIKGRKKPMKVRLTEAEQALRQERIEKLMKESSSIKQ